LQYLAWNKTSVNAALSLPLLLSSSEELLPSIRASKSSIDSAIATGPFEFDPTGVSVLLFVVVGAFGGDCAGTGGGDASDGSFDVLLVEERFE